MVQFRWSEMNSARSPRQSRLRDRFAASLRLIAWRPSQRYATNFGGRDRGLILRRTAMRLVCCALSAALLAAIALPARSQGDAAHARDLAATCANCHGTSGKAQGAIPALAGQPKADLIQKLNDFRDGKRPATIMHQLAKGYTPEQIDALAGWFAQQKP
jgi:cytochrome c553